VSLPRLLGTPDGLLDPLRKPVAVGALERNSVRPRAAGSR
jgi:hypothetical protein